MLEATTVKEYTKTYTHHYHPSRFSEERITINVDNNNNTNHRYISTDERGIKNHTKWAPWLINVYY